ncbi:hypothetical protein B0H14DRAFT_2588585 [Mycena olivaceomarginata]|nr:hypothetical protein B0H14DRAFT_2588585 [Mycena olivaceomarginata]
MPSAVLALLVCKKRHDGENDWWLIGGLGLYMWGRIITVEYLWTNHLMVLLEEHRRVGANLQRWTGKRAQVQKWWDLCDSRHLIHLLNVLFRRKYSSGSAHTSVRANTVTRIVTNAGINRLEHAARAAGSVRAMQTRLLKEPGNRPSARGKKKGGRYIEGAPPPATRDSALRIVGLSLVTLSVELQRKLYDFLDALQPPVPTQDSRIFGTENTPSSTARAAIPSTQVSESGSDAEATPPPTAFVKAMMKCAELETQTTVNDHELMQIYPDQGFR